jgi:hypothetical protein
MRQITIAIISSLVLIILTGSADAARTHKMASAQCPPGRSHLVVADAQAQVYEAPEAPEYLGFFGCVYGQRRSYLLGHPLITGSPQGGGGARLYALVGPIVAFERYSTINLASETRYEDEVVVRNLRNGRVLHKLPTGTPPTPSENGDIGVGSAQVIVLKSDGAVAWIVQIIENAVPKDKVTYQVHAVDKTGSRVLASGPEIAPSSLALAGSILYWTQDGKPMSAVLD